MPVQNMTPKVMFEYELFPGTNNRINNQPIRQFENFILRNSGNDWHHGISEGCFDAKLW